MKKKNRISSALVIMLALVVLFSTTAVFAVDSITPRYYNPVVSDNPTVRSDDPDSQRYDNPDVRDVVMDLNNGTIKYPEDILGRLKQKDGKTDPENFPTTTGETVNIRLYGSLTQVKDLVNYQNGTASLEGTPGMVTLKVPEAIGQDGEDLLIMQIDPKTGEIYLIALSAFDSETGELQANFACFGPYFVLSKAPLVDRIADPDRYPNKDVAEVVKGCSLKEYLTLSDWMGAQGIKDSTLTFEVPADKVQNQQSSLGYVVDAAEKEATKTVTVNVNDYEGVTLLSDVALRMGVQDFGYNLNTKIKANLYQDLDRSNWTRVLNYSGISYNLEEIKKNPSLLSKIEPFVLKEAFLYHIDATTNEVSVVYEPIISFDTFDEDAGVKIELQDNQEQQNTTNTSSLFDNKVYAEMKQIDKNWTWFDVDDIDEDNTSNYNMVISGDGYLGLGPFILFIPKAQNSATSLWWLWLILALVVIAVVVYVVYKNKKKKAE